VERYELFYIQVMVMVEDIESLLHEFRHELFLYPWEIFELRIQEEMVRADRTGSGFGYMEIGFAVLRHMIHADIPDKVLWRFLIQYVAETLRGSDIKGFLADNSGIGVVLLDSGNIGAEDCRTRFFEKLRKAKWLKDEKDMLQIKVTHYPLEGIR